MFKKIIIIISFGFLVLSVYGNFALAQENTISTINVYPDIYYPIDESLYLEGRAKPDSIIQINFQKQGSKPRNFTVKSNANGEWVFAEKIPLEAGDWEVRARENFANGKLGEWSNPRVFKVIQNGIIIAGVSIKFAVLAFTIFFFLLLSGFIFWYFNARVRLLKEIIVKKEAQEAHESVREGIAEIRKDLLNELKLLTMSNKELSNEEIQRKEHVLRELDRVENEMNKEIRDIEENIG